MFPQTDMNSKYDGSPLLVGILILSSSSQSNQVSTGTYSFMRWSIAIFSRFLDSVGQTLKMKYEGAK